MMYQRVLIVVNRKNRKSINKNTGPAASSRHRAQQPVWSAHGRAREQFGFLDFVFIESIFRIKVLSTTQNAIIMYTDIQLFVTPSSRFAQRELRGCDGGGLVSPWRPLPPCHCNHALCSRGPGVRRGWNSVSHVPPSLVANLLRSATMFSRSP